MFSSTLGQLYQFGLCLILIGVAISVFNNKILGGFFTREVESHG